MKALERDLKPSECLERHRIKLLLLFCVVTGLLAIILLKPSNDPWEKLRQAVKYPDKKVFDRWGLVSNFYIPKAATGIKPEYAAAAAVLETTTAVQSDMTIACNKQQEYVRQIKAMPWKDFKKLPKAEIDADRARVSAFKEAFALRLDNKLKELNAELKLPIEKPYLNMSIIHICLWLWKNDPKNLENAVAKFLDENFYPPVIKKYNGSRNKLEALIDGGVLFLVDYKSTLYLCMGYYEEKGRSYLVLFDPSKVEATSYTIRKDRSPDSEFVYMGAHNRYKGISFQELNENMTFINICRRKQDEDKIHSYCKPICEAVLNGEDKKQ